MMKFRAYNKTTEQFLDQTYLSINGDGDIITYDWHSNHGRSWGTSFDEIIIQHAIGMQDKHGVDIYEGDIVECYKWFSGLEDKPIEKKKFTVSCSLEHNLETIHESGWEGSWLIEDAEIVGNIWSEAP